MDSVATYVGVIGHIACLVAVWRGFDHKNLGDLVYTNQIGYDASTMESVGILLYPTQSLYFL